MKRRERAKGRGLWEGKGRVLVGEDGKGGWGLNKQNPWDFLTIRF